MTVSLFFIKLFHDGVLSYDGLDDDIADSIAAIKADDFCLCLRDWCRCVNESEILVESAEFEKKRKELVKARQSLKQAEENYEAQAKMHESSVSKYNEVYAEMVTMRSIMLKICATDLNITSINIKLPQEV